MSAPEPDTSKQLDVTNWLEQGMAHVNEGRIPQAIEAYAKATELNSTDPRGWLAMGKLLIATGEFTSGLAAISKALDLEPKLIEDSDSLFFFSKALNETGDSEGALKAIEKGALSNPKLMEDGFVLSQLGVAQNVLGDPQEALPTLIRAEAALNAQVDIGAVLLQQGIAHQKLGNHSQAIAAFNKASDLLPEIPIRSFLWLHKANSHIALGQQSAAREALANAAKKEVPQPQFFLMKAELLNKLGSFEEALADLDKAGELDPKTAQAWDEKAALLLRLNRFPGALEAIDKAIALVPDASSKASRLCGKAHILLKSNDPAGALLALDDAVKADATLEVSLRFIDLKSQILLSLGRREQIDEVFRKASLDPKLAGDATFQNSWAVALLLIGNNKEGFEKLEQIAAHEPEDENADAWLICGGVRSDLGQFVTALPALRRAHELNPDFALNPRYLSALVTALSGTGQFEEALQSADALVALDVTVANSYLMRGIALAGMGNHTEALKAFDEVIKLAPHGIVPALFESAALTQKGHVLLKQKKFAEALGNFERAAVLAEQARNLPNLIGALLGQGYALYGRSTTEEGTTADASKAATLKIMTQAATLSEQLPKGPVSAIAWWSKGYVLSWLERDEEALVAYQRGVDQKPDFVQARISLGEAYDRLQDHELAADEFTEAIKHAVLPAEKAESYLGKGRTLLRLERYEEALTACRDAIRTNGENEKLLELLGTVYSRLQRHDAALLTFRRGWGMGRPNHRSAACALGVSAALLAKERDAEARAFLEKAEKETTFTGELHFNYGVVLYRLKESGAAARSMQKAADMGVPAAGNYANRLKGGGGGNRTWLDFWFGDYLHLRRSIGALLLLLLLISLLPAFLKPGSLGFVPWLDLSKEWKVMLIPIILLTTLLLLPILRRVSVKGMEFDISQPEPEAGRPDLNTALKAFLEASPAAASIPGTPGPRAGR